MAMLRNRVGMGRDFVRNKGMRFFTAGYAYGVEGRHTNSNISG